MLTRGIWRREAPSNNVPTEEFHCGLIFWRRLAGAHDVITYFNFGCYFLSRDVTHESEWKEKVEMYAEKPGHMLFL